MGPLRALALPLLAVALAPSSPRADQAAASRPAPKLAVVIVFDQMRDDYLERFAPAFGDDGFRRLLREGTRYVKCNYPYAVTETAPGHATLGSGRMPRNHGIVANDLYDGERGRVVYSLEDSKEMLRGPEGDVAGLAMSPKRFKGESLADRWVEETQGKGRVFALSFKDRGAIPVAGRRPALCLWFLPQAGVFGSSTFYPPPPAWLGAFARSHSLDALPQSWDRALPEASYATMGPDDAGWESPRAGMGRVFPHPFDRKRPAAEQWSGILASSVSLPVLGEVAREVVAREKLGKGEAPDLLWISFSTTDWVGHYFGPRSHELFDAFAIADREVAALLRALDAAVGQGHYLFALSSDHGATEVPEQARADGADAGRVSFSWDSKGIPRRDLAPVEEALSRRLGARPAEGKRWVRWITQSDAQLDRDTFEAAGIDPARAAGALRDALREHPRVVAAYTREEVQGKAYAADDRYGRALRNSYRADRCGDVQFVLREGWIASGNPASHGSPHAADTHVPLVVGGVRLPRGAVDDTAVTPLDLAPTIAAVFGIGAPKDCEGRLLPGLGLPESRPAPR